MKEVSQECHAEVKADISIKGDARRQAMADCVVKHRPDMVARMRCKVDPRLDGLTLADRHAALKACIDRTKVSSGGRADAD